MKIKFGSKKPKVHHCYEIHSPNGVVHVKQKYWRTYGMANAYANILRQRHNDCAFAVRWCKPFPKKPVRML